jgi:hypothetical protein
MSRTGLPRSFAASQPVRVGWDDGLGEEFIRTWGRPRGKNMPEHVSIYGQTGSGKSYFERWILQERARRRGSHVVILATKPADKTLSSMGWPVVTDWPPGYGQDQVIYWARQPGKPGDPEGLVAQQHAVRHLLDELWQPDANVVLAVDELAYVVEDLRLRSIATRYYREGRALGITIVATTQRPAGVVRQMHSEAGWRVAFAPTDEDDAKRLAEVLGNRRYYSEVLAELNREKFEFLLQRKLTGESYISSIPKLKRQRKPKPDEEERRPEFAARRPAA